MEYLNFQGVSYHVPLPDVPFVEVSTDEVNEQRRKEILSQTSEPLRLTRFETDLFYTYPDLIPRKGFQKNTLPYQKVLHKLDFEFIFFDTETTGLNNANRANVADGHRVITLGMVPYRNGKLYDNPEDCLDMKFNPEMAIDPESSKIHGIYDEDLVGAPLFRDCIPEIVRKIRGKVLIAHNASFDVTFINQEFSLAGLPFKLEDICFICDTYDLARATLGGGRLNLDALSKRYHVNIEREFHGALLDSIILGNVYQQLIKDGRINILEVEADDISFEDPLVIPPLDGIDVESLKLAANEIEVSLDAEGLKHLQEMQELASSMPELNLESEEEEDESEDELDDEMLEE